MTSVSKRQLITAPATSAVLDSVPMNKLSKDRGRGGEKAVVGILYAQLFCITKNTFLFLLQQ